jgi:galactokinase/mevalonate kinase-like predicted kinase
MRYHLTVPARINILGNPSDANEGDFATITAAVNVYASALVEPAEKLILEIGSKPGSDLSEETIPVEDCTPEAGCRQEFDQDEIPLPYTGELDLMKAAVNRLYQYSAELRQKFRQQGLRITAWSDVPRQSGLGGSSLFVILTLASLRQFYELDPRKHNNYILAELTQRVEGKELGIACGFADRYVPIFGGLNYLDYRGKLHHAELCYEPFATIERLDPWVEDLPIVAITTGIQHDSGDVHGRMRPRYVEEHDRWSVGGGDHPPMVAFMHGAWETAWRGKIALLEGDLKTFGELMNANHRLVDEMMTYCGFIDGAGWANNLCIQVALDNGALGAKLTGAGGGGSVYALVNPGQEQNLIQAWEQTAQEASLNHARIYCPRISRHGLSVESV